jgi:glycosyltransferase involved in cell wall biosynthesis
MNNISIIIPARNEEKHLPKCLDAINQAAEFAGVNTEIIVVINRCTDKTETIARERNCHVIFSEEKNLSKIRNSGIQAARHEIIVTIDADSCMSKNCLKEIIQSLNTGKFVGGGVLIIPERWSVGIASTFILLIPFFLFWGISAGIFWTRKEHAEAIGGFNENMYSAEDVDFARRLKSHGKKNNLKFKNIYAAHLITSCRKFDHFGDWYALKHPLMMLKLLRGNKSKEADKIWYDF